MNRYDNEKTIIRDFQNFSIFDTILFPKSIKTILLLNLVHNKQIWKTWIDSSGKNQLPPDFYNNKLKLMMDVMRVDDHTYVNKDGKVIDPYNQRESKLIKELISKNKSIKEVAEKGNLFITPFTGLVGEKDHNYEFYINSFKRVVQKHIEKIKQYQCNHPGYKLIFFVADESTNYLKCFGNKKTPKIGEKIFGEPHFWWLDKNMVDILKGSNIDYLIWMAPYKYMNPKPKVKLPKIVIIDVKKIKYEKLISYPIEKMQSTEL